VSEAVPPVARAVVTGASGFIGRRLVARLRAGGVEVAEGSRASVDLQDAEAVGRALAEFEPDTVFHLASSGVSAAAAHNAAVIARDVQMVAHLVGLVPKGSRLIVAGSMSEYGAAGVMREDAVAVPKTAYGIAKLAAGLYAMNYAPPREVAVTVARLFGVYGPGEAPARFFPTLLRELSEGRSVALSDGLQRRDFLHVDDAAAVLLRLAGRPGREPALVNVGTGSAVRVRDVAEWMADAVGAPRDWLRFGARPRSPGDEDLLEADTARLRAMTGEVPPQRLRPGLTLDLFRDPA